ncbi:RNA polymerase sigma-70 factor [Bacteroides sp. GM023]|uniref:RNA polymerase sigma-70 factor n=1 Tax=Bacteroides sp. GM023 TaxID=2723058 RepID=UPI00168B1744|nr:RNA polymerase sigma-70 factor [Bacteroides sp. GM023]MBD3587967.1 RNA polymerase sigma-70 factor [Bacteroides sp. GM023]
MHSNAFDTVTDEGLFFQVQQGREDAFEALFLKYYPSLCAYARMFVEPDDGQEIVSDVMVWLWENKEMQAFELSLKSYLFRAVKNRCLTLIRHNQVKQRVEEVIFNNLQSQYEDPDFYVVDELTKKIEEALASLPDKVRETFEMNRFQDLTYNEIADRLGISPKTVDARIQQALKLLRISLKDYLPLVIPFLMRMH